MNQAFAWLVGVGLVIALYAYLRGRQRARLSAEERARWHRRAWELEIEGLLPTGSNDGSGGFQEKGDSAAIPSKPSPRERKGQDDR